RRWVVEACHSWLNRNRALLIRWSKKPENHLALLQLACGLLAFKKAHAARLAHALPGIGPTYDGGGGCHVATSDPIAEIIGDYRAFAAMQRERLSARG